MPIYTRCSRCGARVMAGAMCPCRAKEEAKRQKLYDTTDRDRRSHAFYNGGEWKKVKQSVLDIDNGIDVYVYMTEGRVLIADVVHHIEPLTDNWNRRLDIDNLMSLNHSTHGMIEKKYKKNKQEMIKILTKMLEDYRMARG